MILLILWRLISWELMRLYDTEALKLALYDEPDELKQQGLPAIKHIFEAVRFDQVLDLLFLLLLLCLNIYQMKAKS